MGYSFLLAARGILYAPSHMQDSTYHGLCYTSRGALAGMKNISVGNRERERERERQRETERDRERETGRTKVCE